MFVEYMQISVLQYNNLDYFWKRDQVPDTWDRFIFAI